MGCKQSPIAAMLTAWTDKVGGVSRRLTHSLTQSTGTRACTIHSLLNSLRLSHSVRHTTFWSPPRVQVLRTSVSGLFIPPSCLQLRPPRKSRNARTDCEQRDTDSTHGRCVGEARAHQCALSDHSGQDAAPRPRFGLPPRSGLLHIGTPSDPRR